jgi:hypothetical protein
MDKREYHARIAKFGGQGYHFHLTLHIVDPDPTDKNCVLSVHEEKHQLNTKAEMNKILNKWEKKYPELDIDNPAHWGDKKWYYRTGD